jgi:undecaprenyl-diphosphatase
VVSDEGRPDGDSTGEDEPKRSDRVSRVPGWLKGKPARIAIIALLILGGYLIYKTVFPEFDLQQLLDDFANFLGAWTYLVVGLLAFLETGAFVGLLVPGETSLLVGGAVAGLGVINVYLLIAIAWTAAFAGDTVSFMLGRKLGREFILRHGTRVGITREGFEKVEGYFDRHGGKTILAGRFVGLVRALAPFVAGSSGMAYAAFAPYSILGSGLQVTIHIVIGYLFAQSIDAAAEYVGIGAVIIGTIIVVAFASYQAWSFLRVADNRERAVVWMESRAVTRPLVELGRRLRPQARFLVDRLTPGGSFGLEFTTLCAILAVSSFVVIAFTEIFLGNGGPTPGDGTAVDIVDLIRTSWLTGIAEVVTFLGSKIVVLPLAALATVVLLLDRRPAEAAVLVLSMFAIVVGVDLLKDLVDRGRPSDGLVEASGPSFPSAHAAQSVFYSWLAVTVAFRMRPDMARSSLLVGAGIAATAAIGLSRVYLGVHYLSDVTAGWGFGAFWFAFFALFALVTSQLRKT